MLLRESGADVLAVEDAEAALHARHLAKPVDAVTLTRTVRDVLYARAS
jgi:hypothetical protein